MSYSSMKNLQKHFYLTSKRLNFLSPESETRNELRHKS